MIRLFETLSISLSIEQRNMTTKSTDRYSAAALAKKYADPKKSGYNKNANKSMSNSSFWLDEDFVTKSSADDNGRVATIAESKSLEFIKLAAYQRAITNFVTIITGRHDIAVKYSSGQDSYTNNKEIIISSKLDEKKFDSAVGLALHEASHCLLTDFNRLRRAIGYDHNSDVQQLFTELLKEFPNLNLSTDSVRNELKSIINVIEDRRIDRYVYDKAPGYQGYYQALYDEYFNSKSIDEALRLGMYADKTEFSNYEFHIINLMNVNRNLNVLPGLKTICDLIHIPTINRLDSTNGTVECAKAVYKEIYKNIYAEQERIRLEREAAAKAEADRKALEEAIQKQKDFTDGNVEKESAKEEPVEPKAKAPKKEKSKEPEESEDTEESEDGNENLDIPKGMPSTPSKGTPTEDTDDTDDDTDSSSDGDSDDTDDESEGTDTEDTDTDEETDSETETEETETETETEEETETETEEETEARQERIKEIKDKVEKAVNEQKNFVDNKVTKKTLSKSDATSVNAATATDASMTLVGGSFKDENGNLINLNTVNCLTIRGLSDEIFESSILGSNICDYKAQKAYMTKYNRKDYILEGVVLGKQLGKKLQTRDEERSLKSTRLEHGRIDKRLIAELGFGNDRVFAQTNYTTTTPGVIHISVDASGSMNGSKWEASMKTAIAIAQAVSMIQSIECMISLRTSEGDTPIMWTIYDSRKDKLAAIKDRFYGVRPSGSTPEGLCYQAIEKEIIKDCRGKDAYFINICDGAPMFTLCQGVRNKGKKRFMQTGESCYRGSVAYAHTKHQVNNMRKANIKFISYFVSDRENDIYSKQAMKAMYGNDVKFINVEDLSQLSKSLNELFERKS